MARDLYKECTKSQEMAQAFTSSTEGRGLQGQRQAELCKFEDSLFYKMSSRTAITLTQRKPILKNKKNKEKMYKELLITQK